jgi:hypothetical protein
LKKEPLRDHLRFFAVRHEVDNYMLNRRQVKDDFVSTVAQSKGRP